MYPREEQFATNSKLFLTPARNLRAAKLSRFSRVLTAVSATVVSGCSIRRRWVRRRRQPIRKPQTGFAAAAAGTVITRGATTSDKRCNTGLNNRNLAVCPGQWETAGRPRGKRPCH